MSCSIVVMIYQPWSAFLIIACISFNSLLYWYEYKNKKSNLNKEINIENKNFEILSNYDNSRIDNLKENFNECRSYFKQKMNYENNLYSW
jgi:ABC-type bacteriocin/lantibiotic exporter with double-glycine peptidase domain